MAFGTLTIQHVDGRRESFLIERPTVRIGRDRTNDLVLGGPDVEGFHAEILADPTGLQILDLGSANGTEVDGRRILSMPQALSIGSVIRIGGVRISVARGGDAPVAPTAVTAPDTLLSDLLATPPAEQRRRRGQTTPIEAAPPPPPANLGLSLRPATLQVEPGKSVVATLEVFNRGVLAEEVRLEVRGPTTWVALFPEVLPLQPGERGEVQVIVSPPRTSESRAGEYAFELLARPVRLPDTPFSTVGRLRVAAYTEFHFELLDPRAHTGWLGGRYTVQIHNTGNLALPFTLIGNDEVGAFHYRFRPEPLLIEPGEVRRSELRARLRLRHLLSNPRTYPLMVTAAPADDSAPAQQASARLVQRPPLAPWLLRALLALVVLALLGGLIRTAFAAWGDYQASRPIVTPTPPLEPPPPPPPPSEEILPTIEPVNPAPPDLPTITPLPPAPPQIIVPPVVITVMPPAQPPPQIIVPVVTVPPVPSPAPIPPDRVVTFETLAGNAINGRTPIRGDEFVAQDVSFCIYREIPLPAPPGPAPQPNDPPQTVEGLTLSVNDGPDPVQTGNPQQITVELSNSQVGRNFFGLAVTLAPPPGATANRPTDPRCQVQPDGRIACSLTNLGDANREQFQFSLNHTQPGLALTLVEVTALVGDAPDAPARPLSLRAAALSEVVAPPPPVADCGAPNLQLLRESLERRNPQSFLLQVPPVIYPPPAGVLQIPTFALTSDRGPEQFAPDAIAALTFQRPIAQAMLTVYFPGPNGNFLQLFGFDEQGRLIATFQTDQLSVPGLYQLPLRGVERPLRLVLAQNVAPNAQGPIAVSSGGIFVTRVELNFTNR